MKNRGKIRKAISFIFYTSGVSFILRMLLDRKKVYAPILCYHSIADNNLDGALSVSALEEQLAYLSANNYVSIGLDELLDGLANSRTLPKRPVVITFDDGSLSHFKVAYPLLKKYGFKATFFIPSRLVGKREIETKSHLHELTMDWDNMREMANNNFTFGGHTSDHMKLTLLEVDKTEQQIREGKEMLESNIGKEIEFFAYPFGEFNQAIVDIIKRLGFKGACSSDWGTRHDLKRACYLQRLPIESDDCLFNFKLKLKGGYDWLGVWMQIKRKWRG